MYYRLVYDTTMPQVSKIKLDRKTEERLTETLELIVSRIDNKENMHSFLLSFLSQTEKLMLAKRLAGVIMIKEGFSDTQISNSLHLTRVTVSRLRFFLEARGEGYEVAFRILSKEKVLKEVKDLLSQLVRYSVKASGGRI